METSGETDIDAVPDESTVSEDRVKPTRESQVWTEWLRAFGIISLITLFALLLRPQLAPTNLAILYLLGVVAIAVRSSRKVSVASSVLSVAAFDFFCVPPYLTFVVSDYEYLITFAGMLVVALVISTQTARIREQVAQANDREARTQALYRLSRRLSPQTRVFGAARTAAEVAEEVFQRRVIIFLPEQRKISFRRRTSDQLLVPTSEEEIAQWVFDHGRGAGKGMPLHSEAAAAYLPLKGSTRIVGVICVLPDSDGRMLESEQQHLLELFANQTAIAIERTQSQNAAEVARMQVQTEEMRSSLLSAVSHDLRTPLASITGAASTLRSQGEKLAPETREELLESISDEAGRLGRLVGNLLDMTRLETGIELRRDYYPLEEIVGSALQRIESQLSGREIKVDLPEDLPLVYVDDLLFGQIVVNLLENAAKYTSSGTPIEVAARHEIDSVVLEVRDRGPGLDPGEEERVFEKFYRGAGKNGSKDARGAGLGLAICRAITMAHRGTISARNREGGGTIFRVSLPLPETVTKEPR